MHHGIEPGAGRGLGRQPGGHARVNHRYIRLHKGGKELHLHAVGIVADNGHARAFGTGAGSGGHHHKGNVLATHQILHPADGQDVIRLLREHQAHALGGIDDRATAHSHQGIAATAAVEGGNIVHHLERGIHGNIREGAGGVAALGRHGIHHLLHSADFCQHRIRKQHGSPGAQVLQLICQPLQGRVATEQLHGILKFKVFVHGQLYRPVRNPQRTRPYTRSGFTCKAGISVKMCFVMNFGNR